jgi:hypothetical protein
MKSYPSIPKQIVPTSVYAFAKIDGSNIRAEWSKKKGFYKFGSRTQLLVPEQKILYRSIDLIKNREWELTEIAEKQKWDRAIFFFEFFGDKSFCGNHDEDDEHKVSLIDVNPHKRGIIPPKEFLETFKYVEHCPVLYHGDITEEFVDSVKQSTLPDMPTEGVVCKARNPKDPRSPIMFKIKSRKWLDNLSTYCKGDAQLFARLS